MRMGTVQHNLLETLNQKQKKFLINLKDLAIIQMRRWNNFF